LLAPGIAAFFDMDRTLIRVNSGQLWVRYLRERGEISWLTSVRALAWLAQYKLSILDMETVSARVVAGMAGDSERELADKSRVFFAERIAHHISDEGRRAIAAHRAEGHEVALLTSSTRYVAEPLAEALGIEHILCTTLGVRDGRFDGTLPTPACYGERKVERAEQFCRARGLALEPSYFYTDSFSDLPLLERVAGARVVNPDARLARFAAHVGWEVLTW
jgi:HAD superfamily hydrolase (TIGR01490 family)